MIEQTEASSSQNPPPPVSQPETSKKTPEIVVLLLLFFLPPLGLYFMCKDKKYYSWFTFFLIFNGVVNIFTVAVLYLFVYPQMTALYTELNVAAPVVSGVSFGLSLFYGIGSLVYGFVFSKKVKSNTVSRKDLIISIVFLVLFYIVGPTTYIAAIIQPMYALLSQIK